MKPKILILDDQAQYLRSLARALRTDYDLALASTMDEAKRMLSEGISLVLTDICLDEASADDRQGIEFIRFVHSHRPAVPVIVMSAIDSPEIKDTSLVAGATQFLRKPILVSSLRKLIEKLVGESSS